MAEIVGVDHVRIGTDQFDARGCVEDYTRWVHLVAAMLRSGFTPEEAGKIAGGNYLRTFRAAVGSRPQLEQGAPAMKNISGKTAIVTGAASGIGLGIATALAEAGANVVMADIQKDAVEEAAHGLSGTNKPVLPVQMDVTLEQSRRGRRKKLDVAKRREIAESVITGRKSGAEMARLYNVSQPTVSRIVAQHRMVSP